MTTPLSKIIEEKKREFGDRFYSDSGMLKCMEHEAPASFAEIKNFIVSAQLDTARVVIDLVREKIEELGHQQDDDTIWCNMDEVLASLQEITKDIK